MTTAWRSEKQEWSRYEERIEATAAFIATKFFRDSSNVVAFNIPWSAKNKIGSASVPSFMEYVESARAKVDTNNGMYLATFERWLESLYKKIGHISQQAYHLWRTGHQFQSSCEMELLQISCTAAVFNMHKTIIALLWK